MINRLFCTALLVVAGVKAQGASVYENFGLVTKSPQIDSPIFINRGTFDLSDRSDIPFETQNTKNFQNYGTLSANVGFRFSYNTPQMRLRAESFFNNGRIYAFDSPISKILINARNITSPGYMSIGQNGLMRINGANVNLSRGGIRAGDEPGSGGGGDPLFNFLDTDDGVQYFNQAGVVDLYSGVGVNAMLDPAAQNNPPFNSETLVLPRPSSNRHQVFNFGSRRTNFVQVPIYNSAFLASATGNFSDPTNLLIQAVFFPEAFADSNLTATVRWAPESAGFGAMIPEVGDTRAKVAMLELSLSDIDSITGLPRTNHVYLVDTLGVITNAFYYTNAFNTNLFRPSNFLVSKSAPSPWADGVEGDLPFDNALLTQGFDGLIVTNNYSGYSAGVDLSTIVSGQFGNIFFRSGPFSAYPDGLYNQALTDPANAPGKIFINAEALDMTLLRLRSDGAVTITAKNLVGKNPRKLDSPYMSLDLGTPGRPLKVSDLVQESVRRLSGTISAWSTVYTNYQSLITTNITNIVDATTGLPVPTNELVTNSVIVRIHALIVDPNFQTIVPVDTFALNIKGTDMIFEDMINLTKSFKVDGRSFHNKGSINILVSTNLNSSNLKNITILTNEGFISVPNLANFGFDRTQPYGRFQNSGYIIAASLMISAKNVVNSGFLVADDGPVRIKGSFVKLDDGTIDGLRGVNLSGGELKARNSMMNVGSLDIDLGTGQITHNPGVILLNFTTRISDGGPDAGNSWTNYGGLELSVKPTFGDLTGTHITSVSAPFAESFHRWAGKDRGAKADGFVNNVAVGRLTLDGGFGSVFHFIGKQTNVKSAIYVAYLEFLNNAADVDNGLIIDPNFKIYFGDSNLPPEELNGKFGGRLRYVPGISGAE